MGDANTKAVLRYLAGLNGTKPLVKPPRGARRAREEADEVLRASLSLEDAVLGAALSGVALSASSVAFLVYLAVEFGASRHQRDVAMAKNAAAREFVRGAWRDRDLLSESKASFARRHVSIVLKKYRTKITADTIARDWLPSSSDEPATWPLPSAAIAWTGRSFVPRKR